VSLSLDVSICKCTWCVYVFVCVCVCVNDSLYESGLHWEGKETPFVSTCGKFEIDVEISTFGARLLFLRTYP
jgi:hypothetical protein